jgi:hypothetical protein
VSISQPPPQSSDYLFAAAPLAIIAVLAPLIQLMLGDATNLPGTIATGVAAVPAALVGVRLTKRVGQGATPGQPIRRLGAGARSPRSLRPLLIVLAALGFMIADLASWLMALGSDTIVPIDAADDDSYYNGVSIRAIVLFFLLSIVVARAAALRLEGRVVAALNVAVAIYVVGNTLQNLLLGSTLTAQYIAWTFGYVLAVLAAVRLGELAAR